MGIMQRHELITRVNKLLDATVPTVQARCNGGYQVRFFLLDECRNVQAFCDWDASDEEDKTPWVADNAISSRIGDGWITDPVTSALLQYAEVAAHDMVGA